MITFFFKEEYVTIKQWSKRLKNVAMKRIKGGNSGVWMCL